MIRTQLYLPEEEYKILVMLARQKSQPMAEFVRGFIKEGLKKEKTLDRTGRGIMMALSRMKIKGGPKDLSSNIDSYLFGETKKKSKK